MDFERALSDARAAFNENGLTRQQREALAALIAAAEWGLAAERALADALLDAQRHIKEVPEPSRKDWLAGVTYMCTRQAEMHGAHLPEGGQLGVL